MKKRAFNYVVLAPVIYFYSLAENHFNFNISKRALTLEFFYEYINGWRILFNKEYKDRSIEVSNYDFKVKVNKIKFDLLVAFTLEALYGKSYLRFDKNKKSICRYYNTDDGSNTLEVIQLDKDRFKLNYYNDCGWNKTMSLYTDYIFTQEQVIAMIKLIKNKK